MRCCPPARPRHRAQLLGILVRALAAGSSQMSMPANRTPRKRVSAAARVRTGASGRPGLAFEKSHHISCPSISDPVGMLASRFGPLAPPATPDTYVLDRGDRIAWAWFGRTDYGAARARRRWGREAMTRGRRSVQWILGRSGHNHLDDAGRHEHRHTGGMALITAGENRSGAGIHDAGPRGLAGPVAKGGPGGILQAP